MCFCSPGNVSVPVYAASASSRIWADSDPMTQRVVQLIEHPEHAIALAAFVTANISSSFE